jgi:hypothetical protein
MGDLLSRLVDSDKEGKGVITLSLSNSESAWAHLEDVFAKTRFISYPEDYQPDHYFHYASQREDISFMKQAEELYHEMIREWLANNNVN